MNKSIIFIDASLIKLQLAVPRRLTIVTMSPIEPVDSNPIPHYIIVTRDTWHVTQSWQGVSAEQLVPLFRLHSMSAAEIKAKYNDQGRGNIPVVNILSSSSVYLLTFDYTLNVLVWIICFLIFVMLPVKHHIENPYNRSTPVCHKT